MTELKDPTQTRRLTERWSPFSSPATNRIAAADGARVDLLSWSSHGNKQVRKQQWVTLPEDLQSMWDSTWTVLRSLVAQ
ncbi:hypothetical protein [Streptomyces chattanoogensis]|uniref:hypothetical protein n=1 Tax=Streptomyces chattanoogensis TaxID=66876 RepID=UPI0036A97CCF